MQTLADFIAQAPIRFTVKPIDRNPHNSDWGAEASHWRCTLTLAGRRMSVPFSQGSAHTQPPKLADVLNSLALDASGFAGARDFAGWCAEYGYDVDSRKAEKIYKTVGRQAASLKALLGTELYQSLLWNTESL